jgi:hypothetical protein
MIRDERLLTADTITDEQIRALRWADLSEPGAGYGTMGEAFKLSRIAPLVRSLPPLDWLTGAARDAVRVGVALAGFDPKELITALAMVRGKGERLNAATVYRVMGEIAQRAERVRCAKIINACEARST